ncbi:ABC transporter substrate-binding protein [Paenibacillus sp. 1P07SE]|uniref:ABC transporter substrate-binding protein n=1 Tax=Paenibacillus sp. 1P07SE TaxID=3132209 RepID=UPI0039A43EAD
MSRRRYTMLLLGLVLLVVLLMPLIMLPGSLSQDAEGKEWLWAPHPSQEEEPSYRQLDVTVSMTEEEVKALQVLSDRFAAQHPGTEVQIRNLPYIDSYEQLRSEAAMRELTDIILLESGWVQEFAARGYLDPLDDLFTAESLADHLAPLLQQVKWNGYIWGMPLDGNPYITVWSRALLEEAGRLEPPADWAELVLLTDELRQYERQGSDPLAWVAADNAGLAWISWLAALQAGAAADNLQEQLILPEEVWQFLSLAMADNRIRLSPTSEAGPLATELIQGELLSSVMPWTVYLEAAQQGSGEQLLLAMDGDRLLMPGGRSYVVADTARDKELAHAWIAAVASPEAQREAWQRQGSLPARSSLYSIVHADSTVKLPEWLYEALAGQPLWPPDPHLQSHLSGYEALSLAWAGGAYTGDEYRESWEKRLLNFD